MNSNTLKFLGAAALLGTWGAFAFLGKTPVDGFIAALGAALSGLGVYHVSTSPGTPVQYAATATLGETFREPTASTPPAAPQAPATPATPQ